MRPAAVPGCALLALLLLASAAGATEYFLGAGAALPQGGHAGTVTMAGIRHALPAGLLGEASLQGVPSSPGGGALSTLAYARPWRGARTGASLRTGAGVLALHAPDRDSPVRADLIAATGFQLACGVQLPLASGVGVDLDARYVFFERPRASVAPDRFATRYWTLTLGLAFLGDEPERRR